MRKLFYDKKRRNEKIPYFCPQYKFIVWKRFCESTSEMPKIIYYIVRFIYEHYRIKYLIDIAAKTQIGRGFRIEHIGNIVINPNAKLGCNVTLLNGVLIGSQKRGTKEGAPIIGNKVWIGTNAIIVGKIQIGNDVLIAPGSYVNFDVPDHSIVIGNPGKIINKDNATRGYIINPIDECEYDCIVKNDLM